MNCGKICRIRNMNISLIHVCNLFVCFLCVVWLLWMSHWTCSRAVSHHGRQTGHQQHPGICLAVGLLCIQCIFVLFALYSVFYYRPKFSPSLSNSKFKTWWHRRKLKPAPSKEVIDEPDTSPEISPWESNYQLLVCEGLFDEYLEMGETF